MKVYAILNDPARSVLESDPYLQSWIRDLEKSLVQELEGVAISLNARVLNEVVLKIASQRPTSHKVQIDPFFPPDLPEAANKLDMLFRPDGLPNWRIGFEVCTDNRQAIAMNLFKLEHMNRSWQTDDFRGHSGFGIALTIAKDVRTARWDGAVGTAQEYEYALHRTFAKDLKTPIALLVIDF